MSSSPSSSSNSEAAPPVDLGPLQDVSARVEVVLGTATISVRECLALGRRHVIRLMQGAGSELQVTVNGIAIANGEVAIVADSTGIRVTEILAAPASSAPR